MFSKILETLTGKDDVERIAYKEDLGLLNQYLKSRPLLFPKRPKRFLDAATFTQDQFMEMIKQDSEELDGGQFELWVLDVGGERRLPAFSTQKSAQVFSSRMSTKLNKVFSLSWVEVLLSDVAKSEDVDFVDLNLFSKKSWEIGMRRPSQS